MIDIPADSADIPADELRHAAFDAVAEKASEDALSLRLVDLDTSEANGALVDD